MRPQATIEAFDLQLKERALRLEATVVGGAALVLLGITNRQTRDVDILHPELPTSLTEQDANPLWPNHVHATLASLARSLGYELSSHNDT